MLLDVKQMDPKFEQWYKEFMSTRFPEIAHFEMVFGKDGYVANQDEKGRYVINMDKGVALSTSKLPQKVNAVYKNKVAGELNIYWNASALNYNPNKSGEQILRAGFESGVYNPLNLTPELVMLIARSEKLSLQNWWKNGAKVKEVSHLNGTKAEDFVDLEDYYITNMTYAFAGASEVESLPDLATEKENSLTSLAYAFDGCTKLKAVPSIPVSGVTNIEGAFRGCESLTDLSGMDLSNSYTISHAFSGCKNLKKLPNLSRLATASPSSFVNAFRDCSSLPAVFPYTINVSSVTNRNNFGGMFEGSSVKEITVRYDGETIPEYICPLFMGSTLEKITIVNAQGEVREVRTQASNPSMVSYLAAGDSKLIVPAGVSSMKVALVSGVSYSYSTVDIEHIAVKNNPSSIKRGEEEVITSNKAAGERGHYFDYMGKQEQHGGFPAMFDAQYEDYNNGQVYCCGVGGGKQFTKYCHAWGALENSFVQDTVAVTPGEELTISVGGGTASGSCTFNKKPGNGLYNGYVLVEFH